MDYNLDKEVYICYICPDYKSSYRYLFPIGDGHIGETAISINSDPDSRGTDAWDPDNNPYIITLAA